MRYLLILLIITLIFISSPSFAGAKVVIFLINSTTLSDISSPGLPHFQSVLSKGVAGLMNTRTAGSAPGEASETGLEAACLTLGAGTRAVGSLGVRDAFERNETYLKSKAVDVWSVRTLMPSGESAVVQPSIAGIISNNSNAKYDVVIGALGETLHSSGLKTSIVGNSDIPGIFHRESAAVAMDKNGLVDYGETGPHLYIKDPKAPFGVRSDPAAYKKALDRVWPKADFIVIDPGDTFRADLYASQCLPSQALRLRFYSLQNTDRILESVLNRLDNKRDLLLVVSPNLSLAGAKNGHQLAPVAALGPGFSGGLLKSGSTRWDGIITNADIASTVLSTFGLKNPPSMVGRPVYTIPNQKALSELTEIERSLTLRNQRQPLSRWIAVVDIAIVILASLGILAIRRKNRALSALVLLPVSILLATLLLPVLGSYGIILSTLFCLVLSLVISLVSMKLWPEPLKALAFISLSFCAVLSIDLLFGGSLLRESVLSYSAAEGARYYGLGNEYEGAFVGASVVGMGLLFSMWQLNPKMKQILAVLILGIVVVVMGAPFLGADTGGVMSIIPAALVLLRLRNGRPIKPADILGVLGALVGAVILLVIVDSLKGAGQSHMGKLGAAVASGGVHEFFLVVQRKLTMNFMLLGASLWSRLMMTVAIALVVFGLDRRLNFGKALRGSTEVYSAVIASLVGSVVTFAFNDSGVVAAGICLLFPWTAAAMLVQSNMQKEG